MTPEQDYEERVTWEELRIGSLGEGGRKSFSWAYQSKGFEHDNGYFFRDLAHAAKRGEVPNSRTGINNTLVRNVVLWRRPKQEWEQVESS